MLVIGAQIRAARGLVGMKQTELADKASLQVSTIKDMEARGDQPLTKSAFKTVRAVQLALEAAGVEFTNGDSPGVRLKKAT